MNTTDISSTQNTVFCPLPWYSLTGQKNGNIGVCCMNSLVAPGNELGNIKTEKMTDLWNSSKIKELRRNMLLGKKSEYCRRCYLKEENGITSMRQKYITYLLHDIPQYLKNTTKNGFYTGPIKKLDLRLSNLCNFACRMCCGSSSTQRIPLDAQLGISATKEYTKEPYDNPNFWEDIENWRDVCKIEFAGGEPLINPTFFRLISILIEKGFSKKIALILLTNLSILPKNIESFIESFMTLTFQVSIDGYKESYEYIRIGSSWKKLKNNLDTIMKLREGNPKVSIIFMPTIQRDNIYDFPKLYILAKKNNIEIDIKPLISPRFLSLQNIEEKYKSEIERLYYSCIEKYHVSYPEIKEDFLSILSFMTKETAQQKYIGEYNRNTKIMDEFAVKFSNIQ